MLTLTTRPRWCPATDGETLHTLVRQLFHDFFFCCSLLFLFNSACASRRVNTSFEMWPCERELKSTGSLMCNCTSATMGMKDTRDVATSNGHPQ